MKQNTAKMIFALRDNILVSIDHVESGMRCGCICPACGEPLVAKKGSKTMHHFAHQANRICSSRYETSLHLAAKEIIASTKEITLPAVYITFPSGKAPELLSPAITISIDRVELEQRMDSIVPDIVIHTGGKKLLVEIRVTHAVDKEKQSKINTLGTSCIEIDLSKTELHSFEELAAILLQNDDRKKWIYNTAAEQWSKTFRSVATPLKIVERRLAFHADYCPIRAHEWHGKPYANVIDDCFYCKYNCELLYKRKSNNFQTLDTVFCLGKIGVSTLNDLKAYLCKKQAACP